MNLLNKYSPFYFIFLRYNDSICIYPEASKYSTEILGFPGCVSSSCHCPLITTIINWHISIVHIYAYVHCRKDIRFYLCDKLIFLIIRLKTFELPYQNRVQLIIHVTFTINS